MTPRFFPYLTQLSPHHLTALEYITSLLHARVSKLWKMMLLWTECSFVPSLAPATEFCVSDLDRAVSLHGASKFSLVNLTQTQPLGQLSGALCKQGLFMKRTQESRCGGWVYAKRV